MWDTDTIAEALDQPRLPLNKKITGFSIDTRTTNPQECFIALNEKAHHFINPDYCTIAQYNGDFNVENTLDALKKLGIYARNHSNALRIAITGSVGKTTVRHFLAQTLQQAYRVVASRKSYNNEIGVPLSLTQLEKDTEVGIFEVGTNHVGEIEPLGHLIQPDIAIITKIGFSHIGHFGSQQAIALEKSSLLKTLNKGGVAIVPSDDEYQELYSDYGAHLIRVGPGGDIACLSYENNVCRLKVFDQEVEYTLPPVNSIHNVMIVEAVLSILKRAKLNSTLLTPAEGRGSEIQYQNMLFIDDAYNAAFDSVVAAMENLALRFKDRRKVLVLSDMYELGDYSADLHAKVAAHAKSLNFDHIVCFGPAMAQAFNQPAHSLETLPEVLAQELKENDVVLFKGAQGTGLQKALHRFIQQRCPMG